MTDSRPEAGQSRAFDLDLGEWTMKAAAAVAEVLKREGVKFLIGYPVNPIIEAAAEADIRTIIVRQERTGLHMADAVSRISSGERIGVFAMQHGPGSENAFGGVAQAYGDSVPIIVLPGGYPRRITNIHMAGTSGTWHDPEAEEQRQRSRGMRGRVGRLVTDTVGDPLPQLRHVREPGRTTARPRGSRDTLDPDQQAEAVLVTVRQVEVGQGQQAAAEAA